MDAATRSCHLMTMADNLRLQQARRRSRAKQRTIGTTTSTQSKLPFTDAIPSDYDGMMGVPITFLDKYNPDQFEIMGYGTVMIAREELPCATSSRQEG